MKITFSPELVEALALYTGSTIKEVIKQLHSDYSMAYLYKCFQGELAISPAINDVLNDFWTRAEFNSDDLEALYNIIDYRKQGRLKMYKLQEVQVSEQAHEQK